MNEYVQLVLDNWGLIFPIAVTVASVVVKLTPTETDNKVLAVVLKCFEKVAMNNKPVEVKSEK